MIGNDYRPTLRLKIFDISSDVMAIFGVEHRERLVKDQQLGFRNKKAELTQQDDIVHRLEQSDVHLYRMTTRSEPMRLRQDVEPPKFGNQSRRSQEQLGQAIKMPAETNTPYLCEPAAKEESR